MESQKQRKWRVQSHCVMKSRGCGNEARVHINWWFEHMSGAQRQEFRWEVHSLAFSDWAASIESAWRQVVGRQAHRLRSASPLLRNWPYPKSFILSQMPSAALFTQPPFSVLGSDLSYPERVVLLSSRITAQCVFRLISITLLARIGYQIALVAWFLFPQESFSHPRQPAGSLRFQYGHPSTTTCTVDNLRSFSGCRLHFSLSCLLSHREPVTSEKKSHYGAHHNWKWSQSDNNAI
jgi:hypothetical protein